MEAIVIAGGVRYPVRVTFIQDQGADTRIAFDDGGGLNAYVGKETQITFDGTTTYPLYIQQSDPYSPDEWRYGGYYVNGGRPETW